VEFLHAGEILTLLPAARSFDVSWNPPNPSIGENNVTDFGRTQVLVLVAGRCRDGVGAQGLVTTQKLSAALANQLVAIRSRPALRRVTKSSR